MFWSCKNSKKHIFLLALLSLVIGGCVTSTGINGPTIAINAVYPAENKKASALRKISVLPFEGQDGEKVATLFEQELSEVEDASLDKTDGKQPYFQIVHGVQPKTGGTDIETAIKFGQNNNISGIYIGNVTTYNVETKPYTETETKCVQYKGLLSLTCLEERDVQIQCQTRTADVAFSVRLVDVQSEKVVFSTSKSKTISEDACKDDQGVMQLKKGGVFSGIIKAVNSLSGVDSQVLTESEMLRKVIDEPMIEIAQSVAPSVQLVNVAVKTSMTLVEDEAARKTFSGAYEFLRDAGDAETACERWAMLEQNGHRDPNLSYNLGVCYELNGDIQEALNHMEKGKKMLLKPDKDFVMAIHRYRKMLDKT